MFSLPNLSRITPVWTVQAPAFDGAIPAAPAPSTTSSADSPGGGNGGGPDEDTPEDRDAMDAAGAPEADPTPPTTGKLSYLLFESSRIAALIFSCCLCYSRP